MRTLLSILVVLQAACLQPLSADTGAKPNIVVILVDDMISTGGSILSAGSACLSKGATSVHLCATHPVFTGDALKKVSEADIQECVVTDTIPVHSAGNEKLRVLSVSNLLGEAIRRIHHSESVSSLFL